jgi:uncharacterized membrane protein (UPF0127 family)
VLKFKRALALGAGLGLLAASPALAQLPRQDPRSCVGQPEIRPLEPLSTKTARAETWFLVEVADEPLEREFGLMCRRAMAADRGMLFVFPRADVQAFWMRNTLIPLDIIYVDGKGRIVSIANAKPLDERPLPSAGPARFVLELAAGRAAQLGLKPGDRIRHRSIPRG